MFCGFLIRLRRGTRQVSPAALLRVPTLAVAFTGTLVCQAATIDYLKMYFSTGVDPAALILAGGQVQTWAGKDLLNDTIKLSDKITVDYQHATALTSGPVKINGGFPIAATGKTAAQGYAPPPITTTDAPGHKAPNSSSATITVDPLVAGSGPEVNVKNGDSTVKNIFLKDSVKTTLSGDATAGAPTDGDKYHTADSFTAVSIKDNQSFLVNSAKDNIPTLQQVQGNLLVGKAGAFEMAGKANGGSLISKDPLFLSITDVTDPVNPVSVATDVIMSQTVTDVDGSVSIDSSGIHLTIDRTVADSFVSLAFSEPSSWVENPYIYGATLTPGGFSAFGATPLNEWVITQTGSTTDAFFPFVGGLEYDLADVLPPGSLFQAGHTYTYDVGSGGGVFAVEQTPEPAAFGLVLGGVVVFSACYCRRRLQGRSLDISL